MNEKSIFRTNISQANWCTLEKGVAKYVHAEIKFPSDRAYKSVSWFDSLLKGGIHLPKGNKPLSILITGPPGSGKTTLSQEICYKLAKNEGENGKSLSSLYISTDAEASSFIDNAIDHGYSDIKNYLIPIGLNVEKQLDIPEVEESKGLVFVWGKDEIEKEWRSNHSTNFKTTDLLRTSIDVLVKYLSETSATDKGKRFFKNFQKNDPVSINKYIPDILVVDSLNIVGHEEKGSFFGEFMGALSHENKIVIFVMDSGAENKRSEAWEYACDMIIKLDYDNSKDYFFRSIEIVKARFQSHVWGKHQLKIYESKVDRQNEKPVSAKEIQNYNKQLKRSHPFTTEGGIFIYPSIHYYLSRYKRHEYSDYLATIDTKPSLKNTLKGLPKGRCTAFIGSRGGHKSHFAYLTCLNKIIKDEKSAAIIISLRDDENTTKATLEKIIKVEFPGRGKADLDRYENNNQLDILYFHPGYITPEEFFHRVFVQVQKLKRIDKDIIVMFNSLDQLQSKFPLCASQEIFIPGLIEFLSGENITSIFIAVDEKDQPIQQFGLRPMADLILSFRVNEISDQNYFKHLEEEPFWEIGLGATLEHIERIEKFKESVQKNPDLSRKVISLRVVRFAGGQRAGEEGILELIDKIEDLELYPTLGLNFTPYHSKYPTNTNKIKLAKSSIYDPPNDDELKKDQNTEI